MRRPKADTQARQQKILDVLAQNDGMTEAALVEATGLQRRTINNHLRAMQKMNQVGKDGLLWRLVQDKRILLIDKIVKLLEELKGLL